MEKYFKWMNFCWDLKFPNDWKFSYLLRKFTKISINTKILEYIQILLAELQIVKIKQLYVTSKEN